jgi:cell fate regulator YaaT (PSP1 superfamily)
MELCKLPLEGNEKRIGGKAMPDVVGIRFKKCGKVYDFELDGFDVKEGDSVVVESDLGLSIGSVVTKKRTIEEQGRTFKKILRMVTEEDLAERQGNKTLEAEALTFCMERVMSRGLPMKLICTETTLDRKRIIFYFVADKRIDFRELVKDLAQKFRTRIELRQIGVRDEAKLIGGIGICGRELCCRTFLNAFEPISIKMAKKQDLVLNANKLSGVCGRLMCCLNYELFKDEPSEEMEGIVEEETEKETEKEMEVFVEDKPTEQPRPPLEEKKAESEKPPERQDEAQSKEHRHGHRRKRWRRHGKPKSPEAKDSH